MASNTFNLGMRGHHTAQKEKKCAKRHYQHINGLTPTGWILKKNLGLCETIMLNNNKTITTVMQHLNQAKNDMNSLSPINLFCPTPVVKQEMINRCIKMATENQRLRVVFGSFVRKWLLNRMKSANEEDLNTGEVPKKLVTLYDWNKRYVYKFEAMTILRDMTSRLMNHSYLFPKFLVPRNPYTNIPLSTMQFSAIMKQLRGYGLTNWKLEALLDCQYCISEFKEKFGEPIKREIIEKQFDNLKSEETLDILIEFIEDQHELHGCAFNREVYQWTFDNTNCSSQRIQFWINMCKKYSMVNATVSDQEQLGRELTHIELRTKRFCGPPIELIQKREAHFKRYLLQKARQGLPRYEPDTEHEVSIVVSPEEELEGLIESISVISINYT